MKPEKQAKWTPWSLSFLFFFFWGGGSLFLFLSLSLSLCIECISTFFFGGGVMFFSSCLFVFHWTGSTFYARRSRRLRGRAYNLFVDGTPSGKQINLQKKDANLFENKWIFKTGCHFAAMEYCRMGIMVRHQQVVTVQGSRCEQPLAWRCEVSLKRARRMLSEGWNGIPSRK